MSQRAIKFRTWDTRPSMVDTPCMRNDDWLRLFFVQEGWFDEPGMSFMQFTGLKDKNGVEIYEGDVLGYFIKMADTGERKLWEKHEVVIQPFSGGGMDTGVIGVGFALDDRDPEECEVIGNIYENSDLLQ